MACSSLAELVLGGRNDIEVVLWLCSNNRNTSFDSRVIVPVVLQSYGSHCVGIQSSHCIVVSGILYCHMARSGILDLRKRGYDFILPIG